MTQAKEPDLTMSTIALLVHEPTSPPRISDADLRPLLRSPLQIGQLGNNESIISSNRDQIEVLCSSAKINVRDLSGGNDFTSSKIPAIVHAFFGLYKTTIRSYGINFIITVDMDVPEVWIGKNLLNAALSEKTGKKLLSGRANISLRADSKTWNIQFERNAEGKLEINFNASEEADELPEIERLKIELGEQYQGFRSLILSLGL